VRQQIRREGADDAAAVHLFLDRNAFRSARREITFGISHNQHFQRPLVEPAAAGQWLLGREHDPPHTVPDTQKLLAGMQQFPGDVDEAVFNLENQMARARLPHERVDLLRYEDAVEGLAELLQAQELGFRQAAAPVYGLQTLIHVFHQIPDLALTIGKLADLLDGLGLPTLGNRHQPQSFPLKRIMEPQCPRDSVGRAPGACW